MMNLRDIAVDFPVGFSFPGAYNTATLEDNLEHTGGISISWSAVTGAELPVGASIMYGGTKYSLLEPYKPERVSEGLWSYSPLFRHPVARLSKVPFFLTSEELQEVNGDTVHVWKQLPTSLFTGYPHVIAGKLASFLGEYGEHIDHEFGVTFKVGRMEGGVYVANSQSGQWTYSFGNTEQFDAIIHVNLDGCSIKTAAERIADALQCNVFFDWGAKTIRFIAGTTIGGEYYNCFHVLGGTTNMSRQTVTGVFAQVYERLTLDAENYPGSIIDKSGDMGDKIRLTTDLVLESIYPKLELYVKAVKERMCYATDSNGAKIVDHWEKTVDGETVTSDVELEGYLPIYKTFSQWYVQLATTTDRNPETANVYVFEPELQIAGTTLGIAFLTDWTRPEQNTPLAGRTFDAAAYYAPVEEGVSVPESTTERGTTDVGEGVTVANNAGWFRLVNTAEGTEILPSVSGRGMVPQLGDKVSLLNVAVSAQQLAGAKAELLSEANKIIAMMLNRKGEYSVPVQSNVPAVGSAASAGYIVTALRHDLDTGVGEVTYGTWNSRRTVTGSLTAKIDTVTVSGSGTASGGKSVDLSAFAIENSGTTQRQDGMTTEELETLMLTQPKPDVSGQVTGIQKTVTELREELSHEYTIHFGTGTPTPSNSPASGWTTPALKAQHIYDVYYDMSRAAGGTGGRAWRWLRVQTDGSGNVVYSSGQPVESDGSTNNYTYMWVEITDADTLASLEKIADMASDGVISGGGEKSRLLIEWKEAQANYKKYSSMATTYGITVGNTTYSTFRSKFSALALLLNGGRLSDLNNVIAGEDVSSLTGGQSGIPVVVNPTNFLPYWLRNLSTDTVIGSYPTDSVTKYTADDYRTKWNEWYNALAGLIKLINDTAKQKMDDIASDGIISAGWEKAQLRIDWARALSDYNGTIESGLGNASSLTAALGDLFEMLNGGEPLPGGSTYSDTMPAWINSSNFDTDTVIGDYPATGTKYTADYYRETWDTWYSTLAAIRKDKNEALATGISSLNQRIDEIDADGIIEVAEIPLLRREFKEAVVRVWGSNGILAQVGYNSGSNNAVNTQCGLLIGALNSIGRILDVDENNPTSSWALDQLPVDLDNMDTRSTIPSGQETDYTPGWPRRIADESANNFSVPSGFAEIWAAFENYCVSVLRTQAEVRFTAVDLDLSTRSKVFTGSTAPTTGNKGDIWVRDGIIYVCIDVVGNTPVWRALNIPVREINNLQAEAASAFESMITSSGLKLWLVQGENAPANWASGDLWYNGTDLYKKLGVEYTQNITSDYTDVLDTLSSLLTSLPVTSFTFWGGSVLPTGSEWDVYIHRAEFEDNFTGETIEGELGIWIKGESGWAHVRDNVSAIMKAYGNHIIHAVYGDEINQIDRENNYAAGMLTTKNVLEQFARVVEGGKTLAEALFALGVDVKYYIGEDEVHKDGSTWKYVDGDYAVDAADLPSIRAVANSNAKLSADNVDFEARNFKIGAEKVDFNGKIITIKQSEDSQQANMQIGFENTTVERYHMSPLQINTVRLSLGFGDYQCFDVRIEPDAYLPKAYVKVLGTIHLIGNMLSTYGGETYEGFTGDIEIGDTTLHVVNGLIVGQETE